MRTKLETCFPEQLNLLFGGTGGGGGGVRRISLGDQGCCLVKLVTCNTFDSFLLSFCHLHTQDSEIGYVFQNF